MPSNPPTEAVPQEPWRCESCARAAQAAYDAMEYEAFPPRQIRDPLHALHLKLIAAETTLEWYGGEARYALKFDREADGRVTGMHDSDSNIDKGQRAREALLLLRGPKP